LSFLSWPTGITLAPGPSLKSRVTQKLTASRNVTSSSLALCINDSNEIPRHAHADGVAKRHFIIASPMESTSKMKFRVTHKLMASRNVTSFPLVLWSQRVKLNFASRTSWRRRETSLHHHYPYGVNK
jgi:hypothetical protein